MPNKSIKELVEEALKLGVAVYDHVAQEVFGSVNMKTRRQAKEVTFGIMCVGMPQFDYMPPTTEREAQQAEDRMHRVGVVPFEVKVLDDNTGNSSLYIVHATSALDARCVAFVLDGGSPAGLRYWGDSYVELAISHTEIVG